ncbi:uncharacterized protein [Panulirus ornatus]|uniref:uncharacterized protein isoform X2 n=1 Tax=Panulirus ornatus TaxID=150431 RepID=UPI003A8B72ED
MKYGIIGSSDDVAMDGIEKDHLTEKDDNRIVTPMAAPASDAAMANSTKISCVSESDAVVFSIQFYGKAIGEVGLMDQDLSELDWKKFKSYLFQNLLSMNHQENICVSYNDDEGDKLPIESDEEYREALKIAKKKAETHDKMVLDITRQGGLPTMLSLVSSGIKRVSSSPPKEGGISFFKPSSPPKESTGFMAKAVGTERKLFPGFFSPDRGPIPGHVQGMWGYDCDEALDYGKPLTTSATTCIKTTAASTASISPSCTDCKKGPPVQGLCSSPRNLPFKLDASSCNAKNKPIDTTASQDIFGAGSGESPGGGARPRVTQKEKHNSDQPPEWFTSYMAKFRLEVCEDVSRLVAVKVTEVLQDLKSNPSSLPVTEDSQTNQTMKRQLTAVDLIDAIISHEIKATDTVRANLDTPCCDTKAKKDKMEGLENLLKTSECDTRMKKTKEKIEDADTGVKRKKLAREEVNRKQEKVEERLAKKQEKAEERLTRKQEKMEERIIKKQEKLAERLLKQQEKVDRKKLTAKYPDELDRASRTQEKVLAKMEGLRKKQSCSPEELSKLRKMVDKHHRVITTEQRQQRRNERKAGNWKAGKSKKISIDNKGFPVDSSFLHAALQELEALAEDSPSEGNGGAATRGYDALYLKDITYPDGSQVTPGTEFVKTWRVANSGVMPWNEKTTLCKWTQVRFRGSPAGWKLKPSLKKVVCPPLKPGEESDISITFTAPSEPGWYATHWRFCQRGRVFGNQMWCAIHVTDDASADRPQHKPPEHCDHKKRMEGVCADDESFIAPVSVAQEIKDLLDTAKEDPVWQRVPVEEEAHVVSDSTCELHRHIREDVCSQSGDNSSEVDLEVGIVENYYDAEDPSQKELTQSLQCLTLSCPDVVSDAVDTKRIERDLITFEEDAELVSSRVSSPEIIQSIPQAHAVVPLKEMAKESVESLRESVVDKDQLVITTSQCEETVISKTFQSDSVSISSGSFSELDSEDQAILNESDSEASDHEYYVVNLPECFNLSSSHSGLVEAVGPESPENTPAVYVEAERPDSPDFLTADEDERTTAVVYDSPDEKTKCLKNSSKTSSETSQDISHTGTTVKGTSQSGALSIESSTIKDQNRAAGLSDDSKEAEVYKTPMPHPPTETKPFMDIPAEAIKTYLEYAVRQQTVAGKINHDNQLQQQEQDQTAWTTTPDRMQSVVCEQPSSAQHQKQGHTSGSQDGKDSGASQAAATNQIPELRELPVDLVGALPDELVSIIPEDLVRGVWNTARTFITRINQEMLSPSADSPGQIHCRGDDQGSESRCPASKVSPQQEEMVQESNSSPEVDESLLPPPMQQLEDMGFCNREVNQRLLIKYNNDVSCAVAELIVLNCQ